MRSLAEAETFCMENCVSYTRNRVQAHVSERRPDKHVYIAENTFYISVGPVAALGNSQLLGIENTFYIIEGTFCVLYQC